MNRNTIVLGALLAFIAFAAFAVWESKNSKTATAGQAGPLWKLEVTLPKTNGSGSARTNK